MAHSVMEEQRRGGGIEGGSGTRRRPIGRDYAAAKEAEAGKKYEAHPARGRLGEMEMGNEIILNQLFATSLLPVPAPGRPVGG